MVDLDSYRLRVSARARHIRLRVTAQHGLEVVVPSVYDAAQLPSLLKRKRRWIRSAFERAESVRQFYEHKPRWQLPLQIALPAIGEIWHVSARRTSARWVAVREIEDGQLLVFGSINNEKACRDALTRWLRRRTRHRLVPRLSSISRQMGLQYGQVFVRHQKTRWASCSPTRAISLNLRLLFLPGELVDYVLSHELCHLAELNHSTRFWRLLQRRTPQFRELDLRLRDMWKVVPRWVA